MQVFDNPAQPPDAEFGCCQLMFGPQDTEFDNEALLRVDMGSAKGSRAKFLPLYLVLDAIDAIRCGVHPLLPADLVACRCRMRLPDA